MAVTKITWENKTGIQNDASVARKNKVVDEDMNEIKQVVNNNADEVSEIQENIEDLQEGQGTFDTDITNLKNRVTTLEKDNTQNKTEKFLDVTNEDYNIQVKAYKNGKVVTVTLYTASTNQGITNGPKNIVLAQLGEENGPLETINHMLATQLGVRFNIRVYENGNINISHVYNTIGASSQIVQMFTYVTK